MSCACHATDTKENGENIRDEWGALLEEVFLAEHEGHKVRFLLVAVASGKCMNCCAIWLPGAGATADEPGLA